MKKIRYAAGVVGILGMVQAPGLAAPAAAAAAPRAAASTGKTVSVRVLGVRAGAVSDTTGCTGVTEKKVTATAEYMKFWYTGYSQSQCIGTVVGHFSPPIPDYGFNPTSFRVKIRHNGNLVASGKAYFYGGSNASVGIHQRFADPVQVCGAFLSSGAYAVDYKPLCTSVG